MVQKTDVYLGFSSSGTLSSYNSNQLRLRHLDIVNALREEKGLSVLKMSTQLNASSTTHARDIFSQKRAWNFGSDNSSPQARAKVSGFNGVIVGENVSETFEGEFDVLQVWLDYPMALAVILSPAATHLGLGWYQEENGKTWWVQDIGKQTQEFTN